MVMFRKRQAAMKRRTEEGAVGGVDNAVDLESCNVALAGVPTRSGGTNEAQGRRARSPSALPRHAGGNSHEGEYWGHALERDPGQESWARSEAESCGVSGLEGALLVEVEQGGDLVEADGHDGWRAGAGGRVGLAIWSRRLQLEGAGECGQAGTGSTAPTRAGREARD